jgi:HlyD family secretion protein
MSAPCAGFEPPEKSPSSGLEQLAHFRTDEKGRPTDSRLGRSVRRFFRAVGILVVLVMGAFLISQHLLRPVLPLGEATALAAETQTRANDESKKLVVCFGYADLDGGVIALHPTQSGRVAQILVKENETVPAGAPLIQLDDRSARLRLEEAKALLDEANARLTKAEKAPQEHRLKLTQQQASVKMARYRLAAAQHTLAARQERLRGEAIGRLRDDPTTTEGVASTAQRTKEFEEVVIQEEGKLASLELQDPIADLERVKAEAAAMRARWLLAKQVLEELTLKAPVKGRVLRISVTQSELLTAPPKRMAIQFCPERPRIIRAEVEQAFAVRVEVGEAAVVEDDGSPKFTWRGRVSQISDWYTERRQIAEENMQQKDIRTLECIVSLDPGQPPLRIGQRVRVTMNRLGS